MNKDEFYQKFLTPNNDPKGQLYWLYNLYGSPYIPPHGRGGCWHYLYNFEKSLAKDTEAFADKETMDSWKSCVWDIEHKPQPMAEVFLDCYKVIPKNYRIISLDLNYFHASNMWINELFCEKSVNNCSAYRNKSI